MIALELVNHITREIYDEGQWVMCVVFIQANNVNKQRKQPKIYNIKQKK